jgi:hypothetical protein
VVASAVSAATSVVTVAESNSTPSALAADDGAKASVTSIVSPPFGEATGAVALTDAGIEAGVG